MNNLDPDEDETINRLKKSMNDEANAVLQDQDNFIMEQVMSLARSFQTNGTNIRKLKILQ